MDFIEKIKRKICTFSVGNAYIYTKWRFKFNKNLECEKFE